jgi:hypothetical protein
MPWNAGVTQTDDEPVCLSISDHEGLVGNPAVSRNPLQSIAQGLRRRHDVIKQPDFARIVVARHVKPRQSSFKAIAASSKSAIWLRTLSRSSGSAISSGVSPARLRRGATGTPALLRRASARRERPPCAIGIEAKSCSEFRAEEVPLLILDPPGKANLPRWQQGTNVWRRVTNLARVAMRLRSVKFPNPGQWCPVGWMASGNYCAPGSDKAPAAIPKNGWCPAGWRWMPPFAKVTRGPEPEVRFQPGQRDPRVFLERVVADPEQSLSVRMRAAIELLPYSHPKLAVTAMVTEKSFAELLDKRLKRMAELEAKPINGNPQQVIEQPAIDRTINQPQIETSRPLPPTSINAPAAFLLALAALF